MADRPWELREELDRGQFGIVYLGRHKYLGTEAAVKLIRIPPGQDPGLAFDEARNLATVPPHDNVMRVLDAGPWDAEHVFIASELHEGGNLAELVNGRPLDPASACELVSDLCLGLGHLHHQGLLHLDVRPANVLLAGDRTPRLADFGLARWTDRSEVDEWYWPHAAPELVEVGQATEATDVYQAAMTLAHVLTGGEICRPFPTEADFLRASADGEWPPLTEFGLHVPQKLKQAIAQATDYDPARRPKDVWAFKRKIDGATPAVSFVRDEDTRWVSVDGEWSIDMVPTGKRFLVEVRRRGRRRNDLRGDDLTKAGAEAHVRRLIKQFAKP